MISPVQKNKSKNKKSQHTLKIFLYRSEPVCTFRDDHLKSRSPAEGTGLRDRNTRDGKDLAGEKEAKSGMFPKTAFKKKFLIPGRNPCTVILIRDEEPMIRFRCPDTNRMQVFTAVFERIID